MERIPFSRWHTRARIVMGSATFLDAFDALSLAFVLPILVQLWQLSSIEIGYLIAASYIGQLLGALIFSRLAETYGRVPSAAAATAIMSIMSFGCALVGNFPLLFVCRLVQGIGVGGEMPVAATYISELSRARGRGRFFMLYEMIFPIGLMATGQIGTLLVPLLGWKILFLLGGIPGLILTVLLLRLPESPRWLIGQGRFDEAEAIIRDVEASARRKYPDLPEVEVAREEPAAAPAAVAAAFKPVQSRWSELLSPLYRGRTLIAWTLWASAFFVANGLNNWMPTLYHTVYALDLHDSLRAASLTNVAQVAILLACAFCIDKVGRRRWAMASFLIGGMLLAALTQVGQQQPCDGHRAGQHGLWHRRLDQCGAVSLHARDLSNADEGDRHRTGHIVAPPCVGGGADPGRVDHDHAGHCVGVPDVRGRREYSGRSRPHACSKRVIGNWKISRPSMHRGSSPGAASINITNDLRRLLKRPKELCSGLDQQTRTSRRETAPSARRTHCRWRLSAVHRSSASRSGCHPRERAQSPSSRPPAIDRIQLRSSRSPTSESAPSQKSFVSGLNRSLKL